MSIEKLVLLIAIVAFPAASKPSSSKFVSDAPLGIYKQAAVAANGPGCAEIGSDILKLKNGSAVDAAIAVLLCEGVASLSSMGLGGGFLMTIYDAPTKKATFLNARETAPGSANATMFGGNQTLSYRGGLSIAVPGELMGYWEAHQKYGRISWKELFEPAIELCKTGAIVTKYLQNHINSNEKNIRAEPTLSEILVDPKTNRLYEEGDRIKRPRLAITLRELADVTNPVDLFYRGRIAKQLVNEIKRYGGVITARDFSSYKVKWTPPIVAEIDDMTMYLAPPPGSGALLAFMLNILKGFVPAKNAYILWQRIVETFKWAYAKRTELGDPDFADIDDIVANLTSSDYANDIRSLIRDDKTYSDPKYYGAVSINKADSGTDHVSVLAPDGFGALIRSPSTGIIFNDEMVDFNIPDVNSDSNLLSPSNNFIKPNKRPFSSMTPTIVVDKNKKVALVIGASGGPKITTALASIMTLYLWNDYDIKEAIDAKRLHHQLSPMMIEYQSGFSQSVLKYLEKVGHKNKQYEGVGSVVTAIAVKNGIITANADYRRHGKTAGF